MPEAATHPRLRPIDITPFTHQGRPALLLRDPLRLGDHHLVLPYNFGLALLLLNGDGDLRAIQTDLFLRYGVQASAEVLQQLVAMLDDNYLLDNARAAGAIRLARQAYRAAPCRPPALAGQAYPADPAGLAALFDGYLGSVNGVDPSHPSARAVISPHIDYARGSAVYAATWKRAAAAARAADLVILLGTDHYSTGDRITLTRQSYATPFGVLPTSQRIVHRLAEAIGEEAAFAGELRHRGEHSLELVATWLHHMRGGRPVEVTPILTGSFADFIAGRGDPATDRLLADVVGVLRAEMAGRAVLVVASGDLAHVGPAFGGQPLDDRGRQMVQAADDALLAELAGGRAGGFFAAIQSVQDRYNVCGVSPFWLMLRLLEGASGQMTAYDQCPADAANTSLVSVCGMLFD